jgi:hypothetical protein
MRDLFGDILRIRIQIKILIALKKERTKEETKTFETSIQNILDLENSKQRKTKEERL